MTYTQNTSVHQSIPSSSRAFHLMWKAHHRGFRHFAVRHQGRFHLCGANAVPADVDDVVHAAGEPIEAVLANAAGEKMRDFRGK